MSVLLEGYFPMQNVKCLFYITVLQDVVCWLRDNE